MNAKSVIAVFDIGKTNKKLFLFDEEYQVVFEKSVQLTQTIDEDGDECESIENLIHFIKDSLQEVIIKTNVEIKAVNFSTYGASMVYVDENGNPLAPLYNYLKKYPGKLEEQFYAAYGGKDQFSIETASPALGSLNSGLQVFRFKKEQPQLFHIIKYALHLPQFISSLITKQFYSEQTSIGCHTGMWNFQKNAYHSWIEKEGITPKLPAIISADTTCQTSWNGQPLISGIGLHDSSAALIPYLTHFSEPFILISTGTWCISLNPFNDQPLTIEELQKDCLCYLTYKGKPVKASRLFAGNEHEQEVKRLAHYYSRPVLFYKQVEFDPTILSSFKNDTIQDIAFSKIDLSLFGDYSTAYHFLVHSIIRQQIQSTALVMKGVSVKRIFVDGGFSNNSIYMNLLAQSMKDIEVYAASMPQASSIGAALCIHNAWNRKPVRSNLIELNYYSGNK